MSTSHSPFPIDLRIKFISTTMLQYYIKRNLNPLQSPRVSTIRQLQQRERKRYATRPPLRGRSNARSHSNRSNSYSNNHSHLRSTDTRSRSNQSRLHNSSAQESTTNALVDCNICGGQHKVSTIGYPYLLRQYNVSKYINDTDPSTLRNKVEGMAREILRSASMDSNRISQSRLSQRSE